MVIISGDVSPYINHHQYHIYRFFGDMIYGDISGVGQQWNIETHWISCQLSPAENGGSMDDAKLVKHVSITMASSVCVSRTWLKTSSDLTTLSWPCNVRKAWASFQSARSQRSKDSAPAWLPYCCCHSAARYVHYQMFLDQWVFPSSQGLTSSGPPTCHRKAAWHLWLASRRQVSPP